MTKLRFLVALIALLIAPLAFAVQPDEVMKDPAQEARARELSAQLRCLVCQNESIDESEASLAKDIRLLIRERIAQGESNDQVKDFLVSRYGDFILLKPPLKPETIVLWFGPPAMLVIGAFFVLRASRRAPTSAAALTADEEAKLAELQRKG